MPIRAASVPKSAVLMLFISPTIHTPLILCRAGCGYCEKVCPTHAITMKERFSGYVYFSKIKGNGSMVHARLDIGAENSAVSCKVKNEAKSWQNFRIKPL